MASICANVKQWTRAQAVMISFLAALVTVSGSTPMRLVNGYKTDRLHAGRLEVFNSVKSTWGTVCDDGFTYHTASVLCGILGFSFGIGVPKAAFGAGTGDIWLDNVDCKGWETDISQCSNTGWAVSDCSHGEDLGLVCFKSQATSSGSPVRLADGFGNAYNLSGRLEVLYNNTWGTVCVNSFTVTTASSGNLVRNSKFGAGNGPTWLDQVVCLGGETDISQCSHNSWGMNKCSHDKDIGLFCLGPPYKLLGTTMRLVNGSGNNYMLSGRLEVFHKNTWGTVCDDGFTYSTIGVICNLLGFRSGSQVPQAMFGAGKGKIWLDDVVCSGREADISECSHSNWGVSDCSHNEDVGLVCRKSKGTPMRLVNGSGNNYMLNGRLEVFHNNTWGTVCDDGFTHNTSTLICNLLGFSSGYYVPEAKFGAGSGMIWLDDVVCLGWERDISQCRHQNWGVNNCHHYEDVGLVCWKTAVTPMWLADGFRSKYTLSGRLEVFYRNTWGTVCDDAFNPSTVTVICKLLGFSSGVKIANSKSEAGKGQIWLDQVVCSGEEIDISQCSHNDWGVHDCTHSQDVGLSCWNIPENPTVSTVGTVSNTKIATTTQKSTADIVSSTKSMATTTQESKVSTVDTVSNTKIATTTQNSTALDKRALTLVLAVGFGEAVLFIIIVVVAVFVVRRRRYSQESNGGSSMREETPDRLYENAVFMAQSRRRNHPEAHPDSGSSNVVSGERRVVPTMYENVAYKLDTSRENIHMTTRIAGK